MPQFAPPRSVCIGKRSAAPPIIGRFLFVKASTSARVQFRSLLIATLLFESTADLQVQTSFSMNSSIRYADVEGLKCACLYYYMVELAHFLLTREKVLC